MKNYITISLIFFSTLIFAQVDSTLLTQVDQFRKDKKFDLIIQKLNHDYPDNENKDICFLKSRYYSLIEDSINAFKYINLSYEKGIKPEIILIETDYNKIHHLNSWRLIVDRLISDFIENNKVKNNVLATELWMMYIEDQRFRTFYKYNRPDSPVDNSIKYPYFKDISDQNVRVKRLQKIIKEFGWPKYSEVGKIAGDAAFFIIQHADLKIINKYINYLKDASQKGEANQQSYAMMLDRKLMDEKKKQIYGTQLIAYGKMKEGVFIQGEQRFWPIDDELNLNKRRLELGFEPIEDYAKRFNVIYKYDPDNETKSVKEITKNWH